MKKVVVSVEDFKSLNIFKFINDEKIKQQVIDVIEAAAPILNAINGEFKEYSLHDLGHSYRVAKYMDQIALGIKRETIESHKSSFSDFEYALMVISAVLHDIGMHYTEEEENKIKTEKKLYLDKFTYNGILKALKKEDPSATETQAVHEVIRRLHHVRVVEYLNKDEIKKHLYLCNTIDFSRVVEKICKAHGESYSFVKDLESHNVYADYAYDTRFIAALLRIADLLDIDDQRTPILWYHIHKPNGISDIEWKKHFSVTNYEKISEIDGRLKISFWGESNLPKIHRAYLKFLEVLRRELINAKDLLEEGSSHEYILSSNIENKIRTIGFDFVDLRLNLDYNSITELLMGANIYHDRRLGLRELIQNSIDACKLRFERVNANVLNPYSPRITLEVSKKKGYVRLIDNGTGMDLNIVKNYFLKVGISYYNSDEFDHQDYKYKPIGKFGIGFLACYLLSDKVTVKSKYFKGKESIQIELERGSEYVVTKHDTDNDFAGTEIILDYNDFFSAFSDLEDVKQFLSKNFFTEIPIILVDSDISCENPVNYQPWSTYFSNIKPSFQDGIFIDNISFDKFSDTLRGNMIVRFKNIDVQKTDYKEHKTAYLYDKESGKFVLCDILEIQDGIYHEFYYPVLQKEDIEKIKLKDRINREKEYISVAKKNNTLKCFFTPNDVVCSFSFYDDVTIEEKKLYEVIRKSGITPVDIKIVSEESLISQKTNLYTGKIFKHATEGLLLKSTRIPTYRSSAFLDDSDKDYSFRDKISLYYRDVFICNTLSIMTTPFAFSILGGCVDNSDPKSLLQLNVSRQGFANKSIYVKSIFYTILRFFDEYNENQDETLKAYFKLQYEKFKLT